MKIFNKIVLIFLLSFTAIFFLVKQVLQMKAFASFVQQELVYQRIDRNKINVEFENFEISIFPLKTIIKKVHLKFLEQNISGNFDEVFFRINFLDLFKRELTIGEVGVQGGQWRIIFRENQKRGPPSIVKELLVFDDITKNLPFKLTKVTLRDSSFHSKYLAGKLKSVGISYNNKDQKINFKVDGYNIKIKNNVWKKDIDKLQVVAEMKRDEVHVRSLSVLLDENEVRTQGLISLKDASYQGKLKAQLSLSDLKKYKPIKQLDFIQNGHLTMDGDIYFKDVTSFKGSFQIEEFDSKYASFKGVTGLLAASRKSISVQNINMRTAHGTIKINEEVYFSFETNEHNLYNTPIEIDNVKTGTIFAFLGETLRPLDTFLTGRVLVGLQNKVLNFSLPAGIKLTNPKLIFDKLNMLELKELNLGKSFFEYSFEDRELILNSDVYFDKSVLNVEGHVNTKDVDIGFKRGSVNLDIIKKIADVKVRGESRLDFRVSGPIKDARIIVKGKVKNFYIHWYQFQDVNLQLNYKIKSKILEVNQFESRTGDSLIRGTGAFDFNNNIENNVDLLVNFSKVSYLSLQRVLRPHLPGFLSGIDGLDFIASGNIVIKSHFKNGVNKIETKARFGLVSYYNEMIQEGRFDLLIDNKKISFTNFNLKKGQGFFAGSLNYEKISGYLKYDFRFKDLALSSFNFYNSLGLRPKGKLEGQFFRDGRINEFSSYAFIKLVDPQIDGIDIPVPSLAIEGNQADYSIRWDIFGGGIQGNALLNFKNNKKLSHVKSNINIQNISQVLAVLIKHDPSRNLQGNISAQLDSSFDINEISKLNANFDISDFNLNFNGESFTVPKDKNRIGILGGKINDWDIQFSSAVSNITSLGRGHLNRKFEIKNNFMLNPEMLKIVSHTLNNLKGQIQGQILVTGNNQDVSVSSKISGEKLSFSYWEHLGIFEQVDFSISSQDGHITVENIQGLYGRGTFNMKGLLDLAIPYPRIQLTGIFEKINYHFFSKSNMIASGKFHFSGNKPPYSFKGDLAIDKALMLDNVTKLMQAVGGSNINSRFLPQINKNSTNDLIHFDFKAYSNDIEIRTNIINAFLSSNISVKGSTANLLFTGSASFIPKISKISFKGQDFLLDNGRIEFRDYTNKEPPFVQIEGSSEVEQYRVFLSIIGNTDSLEMKLRSEPSLTQGDILSLITFGYTSDISTNLDEEEREFLKTMSLGSFLIDQLQIGQGLNSKLGLKFTLAPDIDENQESLIEQQLSGISQAKKLKSSTKLKLESNIGDNTNISLSSSLGAEDRQSQELKLDYSISEILSLEGIYENTTNEDRAEETNSFGGDIKFRWIFGD